MKIKCPPIPTAFDSQKGSVCNFSLQYQDIVKHAGDENYEKYQLGIAWSEKYDWNCILIKADNTERVARAV